MLKTLGRGLALGLSFGLVLEVCFRIFKSDFDRNLGIFQTWYHVSSIHDISPFLIFGIVFGVVAALLGRRPRPMVPGKMTFAWAVFSCATRALATGALVGGLGALLALFYGQLGDTFVRSDLLGAALAATGATFFVASVEEAFARKPGATGDGLAIVSAIVAGGVGSALGWAARSYVDAIGTTGSFPWAAEMLGRAFSEMGTSPRTHLGILPPLWASLWARRRRLRFEWECALALATSLVVLPVFQSHSVFISGSGTLTTFLVLSVLGSGFAATYLGAIAVPVGGWVSDLVRARAPAVEKGSDEPERRE
jgi:hypothetical protein